MTSLCTEIVYVAVTADHCSYDEFFVYAVLALFWFGIVFLAFYHPAMLAKGVTHTM